MPEEAKTRPEMLWVRWCDRLEAIGTIGAVRCYQVTKERGEVMDIPGQTPRPQTKEEVWAHVNPERFALYQKTGASKSMMDHYYDKLMHIANFDPELVQNDYLVAEAKKRVQPLVDICLEYGKTGLVPEEKIKGYMNPPKT